MDHNLSLLEAARLHSHRRDSTLMWQGKAFPQRLVAEVL
jgi:hypothetical protein